MIPEIIYDNLDDAKAACKAYADAIKELQEKLGVYETNDDSCCATYVHAMYRCALTGKTVVYTLW